MRVDPARWQREWKAVLRESRHQMLEDAGRNPSAIEREIEARIPAAVRENLQNAFREAFTTVVRDGGGVIRSSVPEEAARRQYEAICRALASPAGGRVESPAAGRSAVLASLRAAGLGLVGIGLPDIPVFAGVLVRAAARIAMDYGFSPWVRREQVLTLLIFRTGLITGPERLAAERRLAAVLDGAGEPLPDGETLAAEVADRLAASLLAAKFLQGMPIAGAAGGLWDGRVTHRLLSHTDLCCRRRFLAKRRPV